MAESHREEIAKLEALYASNPGGRVFVHLAEAYRKAGEHDRARRILNEGLERHSDSASAYVVLGRVLADAEEDNEAEAAFRRVLELDGGNLVALRWLGDLARKNGRLGEARSHYRDLLARNPHNPEIRDLLASVDTGVAEAPEEPTAASAAPGYTDDAGSEEPEFGIVQLDDLPGDLGAFAGIAPPRDLSIEEKSLEEELGIVGAFDEQGEEEPFELADLESQITEEPVDQHVLEGSLEVETFGAAFQDDQAVAADLPVDISDMNVPDEPLGDDFMPGSIDLSGFEEPEETGEPETQPIDAGGLDRTAEFEAPAYGGDLPAYGGDLPAYDTMEEPQDIAAAPDGPASLETPQHFADALPEYDELEFPGEGTEDAPAEALLEPLEEDALQEPATFSAEPPETLWEVPEASDDVQDFEAPVDEVAAEPETTWEPAGHEADTYSAEPEYTSPAEPELPFMAVDPLQAASDELDAGPITEEQWAESGAAEAVPLEGVESAFTDVVGGSAAEVDEESDGLVTETMAELYRAQGFADRAADVYRTLLRRRPHDERLRARLEELEESLAVPQTQSIFEEDESGEVWLRGVGTTWTGAIPTPAEPETPYAWTGQPEEAPAGEPVGNFLRSLVQWRPRQTPAAAAAPVAAPEPEEPLLLDQHATESQPPAFEPRTPTLSGTPDPWAQAAPPAQAAAPEPWTPAPPAPRAAEPWATPAAPQPPVQPEPWSGPSAAPAPPPDPWAATPPAQTPPPDPWTAPSRVEPWSAPAAPPAQPEPWAQAPLPPQPAAPEPWAPAPPASTEPWAAAPPVPPPAPSNRGASPVEAAFDEWYSPGTETAAPQPPAPAQSLPQPPPAAPPAADEAEGAEDEDLEMFRSWLQSLKK